MRTTGTLPGRTNAVLINTVLNADYRLGGRYAGGENHGAYRVSDAPGTAFVLKYAVLNPEVQADVLPRLLRAQTVTPRLRKPDSFLACSALRARP